MTKELFILPVPATSLLKSPEFRKQLGRKSEIICEYRGDKEGEIVQLSLLFNNEYAIRITNGYACDVDIIKVTYAKVADLGETDWLKKIKSNLAASIGLSAELRHLGIYFDDGPLYEFICESFQTKVMT